MKKIYVITGQTATGKTSYAINLAKKGNGELINADSRQIYKGLDIITGKDLHKTDNKFCISKKINKFDIGYYNFLPTTHYNLQTIPIWLYDVIHPDAEFSTFDYRNCALDVITNIISRNKTPIIIGGTYFYLKHLLYGIVETNIPPNEDLRNELNKKTVDELQQIVINLDSELFNKLNNSEKNNPHRLIRKIEILKSGNDSIKKDNETLKDLYPDYEIEIIGFKYENKNMLKTVIANRVEERLKMGAIDEVQHILETYSETDPGLKTIGYTQIIQYLNKKYSLEEMKADWINKELQYAKRQLTFMNQNTDIQWQEIS